MEEYVVDTIREALTLKPVIVIISDENGCLNSRGPTEDEIKDWEQWIAEQKSKRQEV